MQFTIHGAIGARRFAVVLVPKLHSRNESAPEFSSHWSTASSVTSNPPHDKNRTQTINGQKTLFENAVSGASSCFRNRVHTTAKKAQPKSDTNQRKQAQSKHYLQSNFPSQFSQKPFRKRARQTLGRQLPNPQTTSCQSSSTTSPIPVRPPVRSPRRLHANKPTLKTYHCRFSKPRVAQSPRSYPNAPQFCRQIHETNHKTTCEPRSIPLRSRSTQNHPPREPGEPADSQCAPDLHPRRQAPPANLTDHR